MSNEQTEALKESERLHYERRIVAAECGTQRILNALYGYLKWSEHQARFNTDTLDPKAAEILANLAERVRGFDVIAFNEKEVGVATALWENGEPHFPPADPEPTPAPREKLEADLVEAKTTLEDIWSRRGSVVGVPVDSEACAEYAGVLEDVVEHARATLNRLSGEG